MPDKNDEIVYTADGSVTISAPVIVAEANEKEK